MNILANEDDRATIVDVARIAGVSIKTVSRVANNQPHVREETRAKVQRAINLLGYSANPYAKHMGSRSRPRVRNGRRVVASTRQNTTSKKNKRQHKDKSAGLVVAHALGEAAGASSDQDIDWW